jgi:hypothetical protein
MKKRKNVSNKSKQSADFKYFYYINDDSIIPSKIVIRRVKRLSIRVKKLRQRFTLIDEFVKEEVRIKISKKRRNRNSKKNFFLMTVLRNDMSEINKVHLSKRLNENFSHRERLCKKYQIIFKENYKRIKKLCRNYQDKYRKEIENLV